MRFLVLGASGMAGHTIALYLKEAGNDVIGFCRRKVNFLDNCVTGDACDFDRLKELILDGEYDCIVNAIGILNQDADTHKALAVQLNSCLPHVLAELTREIPTRIIHLSTDCVFRGNTGPYTESSVPDGVTFYDRSKALGELRDEKNLTFRNSIVGPDPNGKGIGLLNWFMLQEGPIEGYTRAMWTGVTTLELAKAVERASSDGISGLINYVPDAGISKYDLLVLFNEYLRSCAIEIKPNADFVLDKALRRTNFKWAQCPLSYEEQVRELAEWIDDHSSLYPHYRR